MKFDEYKPTTDQYGFRFAKNGIMIGNEEVGCLTCGTPTKFIEVCSDECVDEFYKSLDGY